MTETHDIPEWYIPDDEKIIANGPETDEIEENGELDEPLCPHCGGTYLSNTGDTYVHELVEVQPDFAFDKSDLKPGRVCADGETRYMNGYSLSDNNTHWIHDC